MEIFLGAATLIVTIIITILQWRQSERTTKLEKEVHRINLKTSQSLQILYRARDAAIDWQKNQVFLMEYLRRTENTPEQRDWNIYASKHADYSASWAELRGLGFAIRDEQLKQLINERVSTGEEFSMSINTGRVITEKDVFEGDVRNKVQRIHTRIAELIAKETSIAE